MIYIIYTFYSLLSYVEETLTIYIFLSKVSPFPISYLKRNRFQLNKCSKGFGLVILTNFLSKQPNSLIPKGVSCSVTLVELACELSAIVIVANYSCLALINPLSVQRFQEICVFNFFRHKHLRVVVE